MFFMAHRCEVMWYSSRYKEEECVMNTVGGGKNHTEERFVEFSLIAGRG